MEEKSSDLAQPATQEAQKEVVNVHDEKRKTYTEQAPHVSTGASPPAQKKPFSFSGGE